MTVETIRKEQEDLLRAFDAWKETYEVTNPPPQMLQDTDPTLDWWQKTRFVWWSIIIALGLYIASRTGWGIHNSNVAEGFSVNLSIILTTLAVWGIEGFIANYGFHRPRQLEMSKFEALFERSLGWISLVVGVFISSLAGLKFSMNIAETIQSTFGPTVDQTLSILLGVGLTFVLFGVSEFVGRLRWVNENKPLIAEYNHQLKMQSWREKMHKAWKNSAVYLEMMGDKEVARKQALYDLEKANYGRLKLKRAEMEAQIAALEEQAENPAGSISNRTEPNRNGKTKTDLIKEFLTEQSQYGHFPEISEIQGWLQAAHNQTAAKSTVSEARSAWQREYDAFK